MAVGNAIEQCEHLCGRRDGIEDFGERWGGGHVGLGIGQRGGGR
ncbi:hypothetical protein EBBID32_17370 [Sphingobium indicum BiD32]|uniref:Uncharacterized protein n=1 Tax=Sphingobium indicum BiD32 TaxID=1301087 RepID=N1MPL4_9SPHN|nr:hypothetical protein EBBID32_17370 [Sphingobium indicum BiD32]